MHRSGRVSTSSPAPSAPLAWCCRHRPIATWWRCSRPSSPTTACFAALARTSPPSPSSPMYACLLSSRLLLSICPLIVLVVQAPDRWAEFGFTLATGMQGGARLLAAGIRQASVYMGQGFHKYAHFFSTQQHRSSADLQFVCLNSENRGTDFIISRTEPAGGPVQPAHAASAAAASVASVPTSSAEPIHATSDKSSGALAVVEARLGQLSIDVGQRIDSAFLSLRDPDMRARLAQAKFASGMAVKGLRRHCTPAW